MYQTSWYEQLTVCAPCTGDRLFYRLCVILYIILSNRRPCTCNVRCGTHYFDSRSGIFRSCIFNPCIFTALHEMQTRYCDENSVRPSVRQTRALWQNGRKICLDFYTIRKIIYPSFMRKRMFGGGRPLLPEILGQPARVGAKSPILNQ